MNTRRIYTAIICLVLLVAVAFIAWSMGRGDRNSNQPPASGQSGSSGNNGRQQVDESEKSGQSAVGDLVSYDVPNGWSEASCDTKPEVVYLAPDGQNVDCDSDPAAPLSLSIDPNRSLSCSQLDDTKEVSNHVCKSEDINGKKSLAASTTYLESSPVAPGLTVSGYYIPAGGKVVKVEYRYSGEAQYQSDFDQLAQSVTSKQ